MSNSFQVAQTDNGPIEYRLEGAGPAVLVLQGGHCSRDTRLSHEKIATAGFTVITPSRPGYDNTPVSVGRTAHEAADALVSLLDTLSIPTVSVIGISAAGPTALALAQRHANRVRSVILEAAVTLPWDPALKRKARYLFGRSEKITWSLMRLALRVAPRAITKTMVGQFTILNVNEVQERMSEADRYFMQQMIRTMQSGQGFMADIEHHVDNLHLIQVPVLVIFSPYDKSVPPENAHRIAREVPHAELYEVDADSHMIWIGRSADRVWRKRLEFLRSTEG